MDLKAILQNTLDGRPLSPDEVAFLFFRKDEKERKMIFQTAERLNLAIHGHKNKRAITFYGVVYLSDFCVNTCRYCGDNIYSKREDWKYVISDSHLTLNKLEKRRRVLSKDLFAKDVIALLEKHPKISEICLLSGDTPFLTTDRLIEYIRILTSFYNGRIILNIPPLSLKDFSRIRKVVTSNILQFRVFQEAYDPVIYAREHPFYDFTVPTAKKMKDFLMKYNGGVPSKCDFHFRLLSQSRALLAGFDEVGLGVLFGLNDTEFGSKFEILAFYMHSWYLYRNFGVFPYSISFPRILPSNGVEYRIPETVDPEELKHLIAITRLAIPQAKLIITCRETAEFRNEIRPIINIEDFEARPGPGGNLFGDNALFQMEIQDRRKGKEIMQEMLNEGYYVT
jgi:2-iminoacetate synthase